MRMRKFKKQAEFPYTIRIHYFNWSNVEAHVPDKENEEGEAATLLSVFVRSDYGDFTLQIPVTDLCRLYDRVREMFYDNVVREPIDKQITESAPERVRELVIDLVRLVGVQLEPEDVLHHLLLSKHECLDVAYDLLDKHLRTDRDVKDFALEFAKRFDPKSRLYRLIQVDEDELEEDVPSEPVLPTASPPSSSNTAPSGVRAD